MKILKKIQNLPEKKRKVIFWSIIVIVGIGFLALYVKDVQKRLKTFKIEKIKKELSLPDLQEELKTLPKIEIPEINEGELKDFEEEFKKMMEGPEQKENKQEE